MAARGVSAGIGERGAVLIQVAVAMLALLGLSAFVFDYGVMWVGRAQAQTAADAGALSGALSLAFNSPTDFDGARARAIALAQQNLVWGVAPSVTSDDVTFPACPPGAPGLPDTCVRVHVFRNQARGNALGTWLARLAADPVTDQGVRAMATAQIVTGDTTDCLRPWAVIDRWQEFGEPFGPTSTYDRYSTGQGQSPPPEADVYIRPGPSGPGTGFQLPADLGTRFAIKAGPSGGEEISSGWFRTLDLPRADTTQMGNRTVQDNILTCNGMPASFASPDTVCPESIPNDWAVTAYWAARGCYRVQTGATVGSTATSVETLIGRDSGARWVDGEGIVGSAFDPPSRSPRLVPIGVMDIDAFLAADPTGNNGVLRMVNIFGFFIEGMGDVDRTTGQIIFPSAHGQSVIGRIMTLPSTATGSSSLPASASFLRSIILVR